MENSCSIIEKVDFLIQKSISKDYTKEELKNIISFLNLHTDNAVLGRVFGYSVSDYAFATLSWIGNEETKEIFMKYFSNLSNQRKSEINKLINQKLYLQY